MGWGRLRRDSENISLLLTKLTSALSLRSISISYTYHFPSTMENRAACPDRSSVDKSRSSILACGVTWCYIIRCLISPRVKKQTRNRLSEKHELLSEENDTTKYRKLGVLNTYETLFLTVLEASSLRPRCQQNRFLWGAFFLAYTWLFSPHVVISLCVSMSQSVLLIRTPVMLTHLNDFTFIFLPI